MSNKFEQLLDYLVNEEMDKANELFHEIVVEKSRDIYESLIAEEEEDEEVDESMHDDDEEVDESMHDDDEEVDESMHDDEEVDEGEEELEDSYMMDADSDDSDDTGMDGDEDGPIGGDAGDDMLGDVEVDDSDSPEQQAIDDIKNAIAELEAALASDDDEEMDGFGDDETGGFGDEEDQEGDDETSNDMMGMGLREYRETVGNDWHKNSQKTQGQIVGANTGEKMPGSNEGKSPISSGKGKPTTGADAKNIVAKSDTHNEDGTKPHGKVGGLVKQGGTFVDSKTHNVNNVKSGVKTLSKVTDGHGAEKKSGPEGHAVGAGTGENSVKGATNTKSIVDRKIG